MVHIGKEIQQAMKRQGRKNTWLASQLNCDASNISKIYKRPSIDSELLKQISEALNFNFFDLYTRDIKTDK